MLSYFFALGATLVLEFIVALIWGLRKKELLMVLAANLITHPTLHLILLIGSFFTTNIHLAIPFLEGGVVLAEYQLLKGLSDWKRGRVFLLSLTMNCFSYFIGLGFYAIIKL